MRRKKKPSHRSFKSKKHGLLPLFIIVFYVFLMFLVFTAFSGCSSFSSITTPNIPSSDTVMKYDLHGTVNGVDFDGVGVIPHADNYVMRIESNDNVDMFTVTSCARDFSVESAIKQGWFSSNKGYEYDYIPSSPAEHGGSCIVRLGAYNQGKNGVQAWGLLDFEGPDATLPATNFCNGSQTKTNGVTVCQSRAGLIQVMTFPSPVRVANNDLDPKCQLKVPIDGLTWQYTLAKGECVIAFMEIASPHRVHRLTTVGYTDIMIRGKP